MFTGSVFYVHWQAQFCYPNFQTRFFLCRLISSDVDIQEKNLIGEPDEFDVALYA